MAHSIRISSIVFASLIVWTVYHLNFTLQLETAAAIVLFIAIALLFRRKENRIEVSRILAFSGWSLALFIVYHICFHNTMGQGLQLTLEVETMTISSRFSVGVHILTLLDYNKNGRSTSEFIASSVNTNPVVIRRIMGMLSKAGLIETSRGVAGAILARPIGEITLLDVYRAVQSPQEELFAMHEHPNPNCPVGRNIQDSLESVFHRAQQSMENELANVTVEQIYYDVAKRM